MFITVSKLKTKNFQRRHVKFGDLPRYCTPLKFTHQGKCTFTRLVYSTCLQHIVPQAPQGRSPGLMKIIGTEIPNHFSFSLSYFIPITDMGRVQTGSRAKTLLSKTICHTMIQCVCFPSHWLMPALCYWIYT